jgi:hypothetical protein
MTFIHIRRQISMGHEEQGQDEQHLHDPAPWGRLLGNSFRLTRIKRFSGIL